MAELSEDERRALAQLVIAAVEQTNAAEVARWIGLTDNTVRKYVKLGIIPAGVPAKSLRALRMLQQDPDPYRPEPQRKATPTRDTPRGIVNELRGLLDDLERMLPGDESGVDRGAQPGRPLRSVSPGTRGTGTRDIQQSG